jgi:hypothetical protein
MLRVREICKEKRVSMADIQVYDYSLLPSFIYCFFPFNTNFLVINFLLIDYRL